MNVAFSQPAPDGAGHRIKPDFGLLRDAIAHGAGAVELGRALAVEVAERDFVILNIADHCDGYPAFRDACTTVAESLGRLMKQNAVGDRVIEVYDRRAGRIEDGARYHQTRQGGDIHTDSVNRPEPMKYLILGCAAPALVGGESILIRARDVVARMADFPEVIETLTQPFWFEGRGMQAEPELFRMPILTLGGAGPSFRYLRSYIESAHRRAGAPLTGEQVYALDMLDAVLDLSEVQHRPAIGQGDLVIADDCRVFHGRTSFIDGAVPGAWVDARCMLRYWIE